jgi:hypothetical protein
VRGDLTEIALIAAVDDVAEAAGCKSIDVYVTLLNIDPAAVADALEAEEEEAEA